MFWRLGSPRSRWKQIQCLSYRPSWECLAVVSQTLSLLRMTFFQEVLYPFCKLTLKNLLLQSDRPKSQSKISRGSNNSQYSFIQQIFIRFLLRTRQYSKCQRQSSEQRKTIDIIPAFIKKKKILMLIQDKPTI